MTDLDDTPPEGNPARPTLAARRLVHAILNAQRHILGEPPLPEPDWEAADAPQVPTRSPPRSPSRKPRTDAGDVPAKVAALRLGMDVEDFEAALPNLIARGFPSPEPHTGNFDIEAVDAWRHARHPHLFPSADMGPRDAATVVSDRIARMRGVSHG